jgi:glycosyltransferase involved in cell wall biosynthesis/2-polyprenyl-3-methyl-5-hydroxy-6-metoxy-1,4-benzoquinol methylase
MNILIFSHSSALGGAENALFDFVSLLIREHQVSAMLPAQKGDLVDRLKSIDVKCGVLPISFSLPNPANALLHFFDLSISPLITQLKTLNYDLVITNTIVTLPGMLIARELNIPCMTYVHEYLLDDQDLSPHGCTAAFYLQLVSSLSSHLLCASEYVKSSFFDQEKCSVLYPFAPYVDLNKPQVFDLNIAEYSLLVIGTKSLRKNTHFAITVLKALRLRGINLSLHIIGSDSSGSFKLNQQALIRSEKNVFIYPHLSDPFNIPGKKINLVCSYSEPFGLTISESLARGIPIAASRSGGPSEILPEDFIYGVDNISECVRVLEKIINNYEECAFISKSHYLKIIKKNNIESRMAITSKAIGLAVDYFNNSPNRSIPLNLECFQKIHNLIITSDQIAENISVASKNSPNALSVADINELICEETKSPGASVLRDIHKFDAVPFGRSKNMNDLYKNGLGLAIEFLANIKDAVKKNMIAYIVMRLQELKLSHPKLKILCLGDCLGVNSIILASCGFQVDYFDFDKSLMSACAKLNLETVIANEGDQLNLSFITMLHPPYDVIISLEVINLSSNPQEFLKCISENLAPGGLLFICESFDSIYDDRPTHLYLNEKFSSTLPILAAPYFKLEDVNSHPVGKPYLFSKNLTNLIQESSLSFFDDPLYFNIIGNAKAKIGF